MPKPRPTQNSFTAGEITPFLQRRSDFTKHAHAVELLDNFIVLPHGGIVRRSGTRYVATCASSTENTRLVPFIISFDVAYILEFRDQSMRVYKDEALVAGPIDVSNVFTQTQIMEFDWAQSANVMYFTHGDQPMQRLTRTSDTAWAFTEVVFFDGPYNKLRFLDADDNPDDVTLTPSATVGNIDITASAAFFTDPQDIDRQIRIFHTGTPDTWGTAVINTITSPTVAACTVSKDRDFGSTTASNVWRISTFHSGAAAGYPKHVAFHEERLVLGGYPAIGNKVWGSVPDDFVNFSPTEVDGQVVDNNAYDYLLATGLVDEITWLMSDLSLLVGTESGPYSITSGSAGGSITPLSVNAVRETSRGSSKALPVRIDRSTLYLSSTGREMLEAFFDFNTGGFVTPSASILAEHLLRDGLTAITSTFDPYHTVWGYKDDLLLSMTFLKDQRIVAWAQHHVAGSFGAGNAIIESIATVPSKDGSHEQVWLVVKRTVNSVTVRFIEFIEDIFVVSDSVVKEDAFYVDAGITYDGAPTTVITGLGHLEGETVTILGDGAVQASKVVASSQITIDTSASKVQVGLGYTSKMVTLPIEFGDESENTITQLKRIDHLYFDFLNTLGGKYGPKDGTPRIIEFRSPADPMDSSSPLQSGIMQVSLEMETAEDLQIEVLQDQPLPFHLRAFTAEMQGSKR